MDDDLIYPDDKDKNVYPGFGKPFKQAFVVAIIVFVIFNGFLFTHLILNNDVIIEDSNKVDVQSIFSEAVITNDGAVLMVFAVIKSNCYCQISNARVLLKGDMAPHSDYNTSISDQMLSIGHNNITFTFSSIPDEFEIGDYRIVYSWIILENDPRYTPHNVYLADITILEESIRVD